MDQLTNLILIKGVDKTRQVTSCTRDPETGVYLVRFGGERVYHYKPEAVDWRRDPRSIDPRTCRMEKDGKILERIRAVSEFPGREPWWYVEPERGKGFACPRSELRIRMSCLTSEVPKARLAYLRQLASFSELRDENGKSILEKHYDRLTFVDRESALAAYLSPEEHPLEHGDPGFLIFPFGGNSSQLRAVREAFSCSLSVIQGPPGTGKTQTILNILANLLIRGKTAQVVSGNNSATENVLEKLAKPENGLDFLVAALGKGENKQAFLDAQTGRYPDLSGWERSPARRQELAKQILAETRELEELFTRQERLAKLRQELDALDLEQRHFESWCLDHPAGTPKRRPRNNLTPERAMALLTRCRMLAERRETLPVSFKLRASLLDGAFEWRFCRDVPGVEICLQRMFYALQKEKLSREQETLQAELENRHASRKLLALTTWSMEYLRAMVYVRFGGRSARKKFAEEDLWMHPETIPQEYPVILSTTFSASDTLKNVTYDCIIMDEASQVDIATGALALSKGRSAVVVGDLRQLPNVVSRDLRQKTDALFHAFRLPEGYAYADNSFLRSVCRVIPDLPQTLLREHYRCHPAIIEFCSRKFYRNQLLIMTRDRGEESPMCVYRTVAGNHSRDHVNQRQIDVTVQEIIPKLERNIPPREIGVIAPYRDQVNAIARQMPDPEIEADTVHKFQGREKDAIVLMTVDDRVTDFSDDPYLLNVAVSRAKKKLCLVTSGNQQPRDSNIRDLIAYIRYHNFQETDSRIYSVFDLLYRQYTARRMEFLAKHPHVSEYASENILYAHLVEQIRQLDLPLCVSCHHPLGELLRNPLLLTDRERRYAFHPSTHLDFLVYSAVTMLPVLAVEVDGYRYHRAGTDQAQRDALKNEILRKYGIPLLRLPTNGSGEVEKIRSALLENA